MKSSDAKATKCYLKYSSKISVFSGIYVQLFHEQNLLIAIKVK